MKRALFPGSFDPFTIGHYDIVKRGLALFDEIVVCIGINDQKQTLVSTQDRVAEITRIFANDPRVRVASYEGLTIDFAQATEAPFILRGVRSIIDFEYERGIAEANKHLSGIETILLFADPQHGFISSSMVRDLHKHGQDISQFIPQGK